MTAVWLDNLTAVTVTDCCGHTQKKVVTGTAPTSTEGVLYTATCIPPAPVRVYRGRLAAALHRISCWDSGLSSFS